MSMDRGQTNHITNQQTTGITMKKFLLLTALISPIAMADFVSPSQYKDFTCEELREDFSVLVDEMLGKINEKLNYDMMSRRYQELDDQYDDLRAHADAIIRAGERIGCDVKGKQEEH